MDDSDEEGFHQPPLEFMYVKIKGIHTKKKQERILKNPINIDPICLHYELLLETYPKELDHYLDSRTAKKRAPQNTSPLDLVRKGENESLLLSEFFPRKLSCVYNKFQQNLLLKHDMTIIIRNISRRICTQQLAGFKPRIKPAPNSGLYFSSEFEGGNLHCVFKCKKTGFYYLFIQNDTNTHGYNIWFHFSIQAAHEGKHQFVIVNMSRPIKFYESICLPTFSSCSQSYERSTSLNSTESGFKNCETEKNYHSIHFEYEFKEGQSVHFSLVPPYSYSKLMDFLSEVIETKSANVKVQLENAGISELGNTIPVLILSLPTNTPKKAILITARQHPCQTVSSFICQSIVRVLLSDSNFESMLEKYTFFILPMLNPDGVIHGHSRTNILGYDINRTWGPQGQGQSVECRTIWSFFEEIYRRGFVIDWAIDLHGHSKFLGFFSYFSEENEQSLLFQYSLKTKSSLFVPSNCTFGVGSSKRESLRGQLFYKMGITKSMTIESSYYGFLNPEQRLEHWSTEHYIQIATSILGSVAETEKMRKNKEGKKRILDQISKREKFVLPTTPRVEKEMNSDSDPEDAYLREDEREEDNLELARQTVENISNKKNPLFMTQTSFRKSYLKIPQSEQKIAEFTNKSKGVKQAKSMEKGSAGDQPSSVKPPRKFKNSIDEKSDLSLSNLSLVEEKKKARPSLTRDYRPLKLKRKVLSQHKYLISSLSQVREENNNLMENTTLKKSISLKNSQNHSNLLRKKPQWDRPKDNSFHVYHSIKLQTILYPTSHNAGFVLNSQIKNLKYRVKSLKEKDSKQMMNTYSEAFQLRRSRRK